MDLTGMLDSIVRKYPEKDALICGDEVMTYTDLHAASKRAAAVFRDAGVTKGDTVAVMTYNTPGFVVAAFGLWRAGATLVPVNHKLTTPEVAFLTDHASAKFAVVSAEVADTARAAMPEATVWTTNDTLTGEFDVEVAAAAEWDGVPVTEDDIAEVLYTSGTVSKPKGCLHTHRGITTVAAYTALTMGMNRHDRFLIAMPIWHASPLNNWLLSTLYLGGTVVLIKEYHPVEFLKAMQTYRTTATFGAPIAYLAPLQVAKTGAITLEDFDISSMRIFAYGGAPMGAETVTALRKAYNTENFYSVYGMSEMGPVGAALYPEEHLTKAGAVGRGGMVGVDMRLVTLGGQEAMAGQTGEVWLRSDTRMLGYLNDSDTTEAAFVGDWYRTGDLATMDDDGYVSIVDRVKDIIITGGENVFSPEVEEALLQHPDIADAAVIARPHSEWGESVVAVVTAASPDADLTLEEVREFLGTRLARYKLPRELIVREGGLPRNASGKLTKHVLREQILGQGQSC